MSANLAVQAIGSVTTVFGAIGVIAWGFFNFMGRATTNRGKVGKGPDKSIDDSNVRFGSLLAAVVAVVLGCLVVYAGSHDGQPAPEPQKRGDVPTAATTIVSPKPPVPGTKLVDCGDIGTFQLNLDNFTVWQSSDPTITQENATPYYEAPTDYGFWVYSRSTSVLSRYHLYRESSPWISKQSVTIAPRDYTDVLAQANVDFQAHQAEIDHAKVHALVYGQQYVGTFDQRATRFMKEHNLQFTQTEAKCNVMNDQF